MLMSSVERLLNKDTVVIADAMNYIKGFRYQLYCLAKQLRTPHCIVRIKIFILYFFFFLNLEFCNNNIFIYYIFYIYYKI